jgi:hypothetical protein
MRIIRIVTSLVTVVKQTPILSTNKYILTKASISKQANKQLNYCHLIVLRTYRLLSSLVSRSEQETEGDKMGIETVGSPGSEHAQSNTSPGKVKAAVMCAPPFRFCFI